MAIKQDEDFLRYLTMGAAGTAAVLEILNTAHGHRTVELERDAGGNKIWATKIKRLRLADLFCLDCGQRIEVRSKSKLALSMSHSGTPGREWDAGLRSPDLVAFIHWDSAAEAVSGKPSFFAVRALRASAAHASDGARKAASEGSERAITWAARVPKVDGVVELIDRRAGKLCVRPDDGGPLRRHNLAAPVHFYVGEGDPVRAGGTLMSGCVAPAPPKSIDCSAKRWDFVRDLGSRDGTSRYAAIKAAGLEGPKAKVAGLLRNIADNPAEDGRIRLEAIASLARLDPARHTQRLIATAQEADREKPKAFRLSLESVLILAELGGDEAVAGLKALAGDRRCDSELRCAAVWGLGCGGTEMPAEVLPFIADGDPDVAMHALAALGKLRKPMLRKLGPMLTSGSDREATSAAAVLVDNPGPGLPLLLEAAKGAGPGALAARAALGEAEEADVLAALGGPLPQGLRAALAPMWASRGSWLGQRQNETPLDFLRRQRVRLPG